VNLRLALFAVGTAQLFTQLIGLTVAVRRSLPYDVEIVGMRGTPADLARDAWDKGTALSAPVTMLSLQALALASLTTGGGTKAPRVLGALGALNVGGYLGEQVVRQRLSPGGWDPVDTPVAGVGLALAAAMAVLGLVSNPTTAPGTPRQARSPHPQRHRLQPARQFIPSWSLNRSVLRSPATTGQTTR
jgi:hypothetical protein